MPRAQWPGMWQPTSHGVGARRRLGRDRPDDVHRSPELDDDPQPGDLGRDGDDRRRAGRVPGRRRLGDLPGVLDGRVADDRLVDLQTAVDDVEQDGLAGTRSSASGRNA